MDEGDEEEEEGNGERTVLIKGSVQATASRTDELKPSSRKWTNLIVCVCLWLAYLLASIAYSIIAPFFPREAEENKGFTPVVTGVIMSCSPLCVVILSPVFGSLLPHLGVRFMICSGLLLIGGAFVLLGFVDQLPSSWVFVLFCVLLRMTEGVGSSLFMTATFTVLPVLFPNSVGTTTGLFEVAGGLGFALGPPLGGVLYQYGGFKTPFIVVGVSVFLFILPCTLLVKEDTGLKKHSPMFRILLKTFTNFTFIVLVLGNVMALAALAFFSPIIQPFLSHEFNLNPLKVGFVFFIGPVVYMISSFFIGPLSDKLGRRWFIVFGFMLYGVGYIFMGPAEFISAPKLWITCVSFAVVGMAAASTIVPLYADMLTIAKQQLKTSDGSDVAALTAVVSGVSSSALSFGEFFGPMAGGALAEVFSFATSGLLVGEVLIAMAFLLMGVTVINKCTRP